MKALLVYPDYPDTFWGFKYALRFISRKAAHPPLGLLTVAAMLPHAWEKRLVDMTVKPLEDSDLEWADLVCISAMSIQRSSTEKILARCKEAGLRVVAGGPLFTTDQDRYEHVDHLVLNEAEITLPRFLEDLEKGCPARVYASSEVPDLDDTPIPMWDLIEPKKYASMSLQYSRGCPFDCEFCGISVLYGRKVRTKSKEQVLAELDALRTIGWKGNVFFVDDNFIGNKTKLKREILPAMIGWMDANGRPFAFNTEASINLADDEELMDLMARAGFDSVFVGIETTHDESLAECNKVQNRNRDMVSCVRKIQRYGLQVSAGFILGFDNDPPSVFDKLTAFIQHARIVSAMVGLLNAPRHTKLYKRLVQEGRLLDDTTGNNTDLCVNFIPKMDYDALIAGYKRVIQTIYSPKSYYARVIAFLREYKPVQTQFAPFKAEHIRAFLKSLLVLGVFGKERYHYWKLLLWSTFKRPRLFPMAMTFAIYGYHFRKFFQGHL